MSVMKQASRKETTNNNNNDNPVPLSLTFGAKGAQQDNTSGIEIVLFSQSIAAIEQAALTNAVWFAESSKLCYQCATPLYVE